ncbi:MAG: response regulator [Elusimicrobiota bacterium]|jgi:DNA-binding response OmpR family regulator
MPRKKILVVDDDFDFSRMLTWMAHNLGYDVISVASTRSALKLISCPGVDLALVDLSLDGDNGWDVLTKMRKQSDIPIIIMTGSDVSEHTISDARMKGAQGVLGKPFEAKQLGETLSKFLGYQQA